MPEFSARLDCPACGAEFEGEWSVLLLDLQQLDAPPLGDQTCPHCRTTFDAEYPGWTFFGEAG